MFVQLPKSRWSALKKQIVSVPIFEQDLENTLNSLPRTPDQASICKVQLKRKTSMKNSHMDQYISVPKIINAIKTFKELNNKHYVNASIPLSYEDLVRTEDPEGYNLLFPEENCSLEEGLEESDEVNNNDNSHGNETCDEDEKYYTEDPIQKYKFNFDEKTTYVDLNHNAPYSYFYSFANVLLDFYSFFDSSHKHLSFQTQ